MKFLVIAAIGSVMLNYFMNPNQTPKNCYIYKLNKELIKNSVKELTVHIEILKSSATEGYYINLYAVKKDPEHPDKVNKIKLGEKTIFKPLIEGQKIIIPIDFPKENAFYNDRELWLCWEIESQSKRPSPNIEMKIFKIEPRLQK